MADAVRRFCAPVLEPPIGSTLTDAAGHVFRRRPEGDWICECDDPPIRFEWEDVGYDALRPWTIAYTARSTR